jgi:hypothetical protein
MAYQLGTPFDNIESARKYVNQLLAATREAQAEIETELRRVTDPEVARREQALQLVKYKLSQLTSHLSSSHRIIEWPNQAAPIAAGSEKSLMARTIHKQSSSRWSRDLILSKTFHPIRMLSAIVGSFFLLAAASKRTEAEPPIRAATLGLVHGHVKGFLAALPGNQAATLVAIVEPQEPLAKDYAAKYHLDAKLFYQI